MAHIEIHQEKAIAQCLTLESGEKGSQGASKKRIPRQKEDETAQIREIKRQVSGKRSEEEKLKSQFEMFRTSPGKEKQFTKKIGRGGHFKLKNLKGTLRKRAVGLDA